MEGRMQEAELRQAARNLAEDLKSTDDARALRAAERIVAATHQSRTAEVVREVGYIHENEAMQVIAVEHGYVSWGAALGRPLGRETLESLGRGLLSALRSQNEAYASQAAQRFAKQLTRLVNDGITAETVRRLPESFDIVDAMNVIAAEHGFSSHIAMKAAATRAMKR